MPAWILWLMGISYTTVTLLVLGMEHQNVWAWLNGTPNEDGATAFFAWLGITALEGFLVQFLLRAPFTWSVDPEGIRLRFGIWRNRRLAWSELRRIDVVHVDPWDAGGYGVKLGPHGWTYAFLRGPECAWIGRRRAKSPSVLHSKIRRKAATHWIWLPATPK